MVGKSSNIKSAIFDSAIYFQKSSTPFSLLAVEGQFSCITTIALPILGTKLQRLHFFEAIQDRISTNEMMRYTRNELRALHSMFSYHADKVDIHYDENDSASPLFVYPSQIFTVINELGRNEKELSRMNKALTEFQEQQQLQRRDPSSSTAACVSSDSSTITIASASLQSNINEPNAIQIVAEVPVGCITFESFASIIDQGRQIQTNDDDECHMHFLGIVNQYQNRCDLEGKYLLAKDFMDQLSSLQKEEENRVVDKIKNMRMVDRAKIVEAHEKQLDEFAQSELHIRSIHISLFILKSHLHLLLF